MAILELKVTINNQTDNTLRIVERRGDPHAPDSIGSKQQAELQASSNWSAIDGDASYKVDDTHTLHIGWYIVSTGPNGYSCSITPDDGQYSVSRSGSDVHCYHCNDTYTVVQYY